MENKSVSKMDPASLKNWTWVALVLAVIFTIAFTLVANTNLALADDPCPPPDGEMCRDDGGGGAIPAPTAPPTAPDPGPEPGVTPPPPGPGPTPEPGGGGGGGGGATPEPGGGGGGGGGPIDDGYNYYWCVDGSQVGCPERAHIILYYESYSGDYYLVDYICVSEEVCVPPPPEENPPVDPPCVPVYDPDLGITLECDSDAGNGFDWGYAINTWTKVPPHGAKVQPFPRWLVSKAGTLTLNRDPLFSVEGGVRGSGGEGGFWSQQISIPPTSDPDDPAPGDIKSYSIGVRWRMAFPGDSLFGGPPVPPSCWDFDERSWNIEGGYAVPAACGDIVEHAYETSSWGKPHNGARFDYEASGCAKVPDDWTLPAYQVTVPTYWIGEWADEWWRWEKTGTEWSSCQCAGSKPAGLTQDCTPPPGICNQPGEWYGKIGEDKYEWIHHFVGWDPLDLRLYGSPDWYYESFRVRTEGIAGDWCPNRIYTGGPGNAVPIPVIEVQSIIVDMCRLDGTCGDLNP